MMRQKGLALFYMLGYCMKDRGQAHFHYVVLNLTREMIRAGISAYNSVTTAASSINNKNTALSRKTWFHSVMKFVSTKLKGLNPAPCSMRVVTWMLREANAEVHTDWVESKFGSCLPRQCSQARRSPNRSNSRGGHPPHYRQSCGNRVSYG